MEQRNKEVTEEKELTTDHLAMEVLRQAQEKSKAKNAGVIGLTVALILITIGLSAINYRNDCDWRELFSSYDYVSQDGNGQNYYNADVGGNVNNGAESKETTE